MIADDGAAAQRRKADVARLARAGMAVARAHGMFGEIDGAPARGGFAEQQRRARGRIDLHAVMHFENLDVPIGPERSGGLLHEHGENVDAEAHVARAHDRRMARGGGDLREIVGGKPRRADDMRDARLRRERGEFDCRRGAVKSTMPSALTTAASASSVTGTPSVPTPARSPASLPSAGEPARSSAAQTVTPSASVIALTSARPMRPPAPITTSRMSAIRFAPLVAAFL